MQTTNKQTTPPDVPIDTVAAVAGLNFMRVLNLAVMPRLNPEQLRKLADHMETGGTMSATANNDGKNFELIFTLFGPGPTDMEILCKLKTTVADVTESASVLEAKFPSGTVH